MSKGYKRNEHRQIIEQYLKTKLSSNDYIHHINGNKRDNRIVNLLVCDKKEHGKIHYKKGDYVIGGKNSSNSFSPTNRPPQTKLTPKKVREMKILYKNGITNYAELGRNYGIDRSNIRKIILGKMWGHIS